MQQKIRFGVIGTNTITDQFIQAASQCETFELSAIYSRTKRRAQEFAHKYGVKHIFTDLEELLTSDVVDAMYIASPNALHAKQAMMCLNHQKHESDVNSFKFSYEVMRVLDEVRSQIGLVYPADLTEID